jgi:cyclophilin family peptidyl-prolyl cis-trans isomerase
MPRGTTSNWARLGAVPLVAGILAGPALAAAGKKDRVREEVVVVNTNLGRIVFRLFPQDAPRTVEAFKARVRAGFYDRMLFHRVLPGLTIETGDPQTRDDGAALPEVPPLDIETSSLKHHPGTVSMAHSRGDPHSRSEFFICMQEVHYFDGRYTIIGEVLAGMKVVEAISNVPHNTKQAPLYPVRVTRTFLETQDFVREVR